MLQDNLRQGFLNDSPAARARKLDELYGGVEDPFSAGSDPLGGPVGAPSATLPAPQEADSDPTLLQSAAEVLEGTGASVVRGAAGAINETARFLGGLVGRKDLTIIREDVLPEERDGAFYGFVEGAAQFAVGMVGAGKLLKPLSLGRRAYGALRSLGVSRKAAVEAGRLVTPAVAGAAVDFAAFDPYEDRLSNLIENSAPDFSNPVTEFLAADEEDPELLARAKAAVEGVVLGVTLEGLLRGIRAVRINRLRKAGKLTDEQARAEIQKIADEPFEDTEPFGYTLKEDGTATIDVADDVKAKLSAAEKEAVENIKLRDQAEAESTVAALNFRYSKFHGPNEFRPGEIQEARERFVKRIKDGADPEAPETYQGLGLNMRWTKGWEEVERLVRSVEEAGEEKFWWYMFNREGGAGVPWEVTYDNAEKIVQQILNEDGITTGAQDLARKLQTDLVGLADRLVAGRMVSKLMGQDIAKLSALVDQNPGNPLYEEMLESAMTQFMDIQIHLRGAESNVGRALNALKAGFDENLRPLKGDARKALEGTAKASDEGVALTPSQLRALAREFRLTGADPDQILKVLLHTSNLARSAKRDPGFWDKVLGFRTNMLLSGPKTHVVNLLNNAITSFQVPLERWWAGKRSGNAALAQQGLDMLPTLEDLRDVFTAVRQSWKLGRNILDPTHQVSEGTTEVGVGSWFGTSAKWLDKITTLPGRALMVGDEFFKQLNYRAHVRSQALRLAREDAVHRGLKPGTEEYSRFLAERVQEQFDVAFTKSGEYVGRARNPLALEHARYTSFTNDLEYGIGNWLREGANKYPFVRLILPFVRTPVNIVRFAWQRTPVLNRLQRQWAEDMAAGGERAAYAKARTEVGAVLYGTGALLALQGRITGNGPSDPKLRKLWLDAGNQPYSIRLPDGTSIQYNRLEPLATPLALIADGVEAWGELDEDDAMDVVFATMGALASSISSKTFLFGLADFFDAVGRGDTYMVRRLTTNWITSFHPNFLRQMNWDDTYREARSVIDEIRARTPGLSDKLEPRRNLFGEPVLKPPVYFQRAVNPFTVMTAEEDDETFAKLVELGRALPMPSRTRFEGEIDLADRQKYDNGTGQSPYDRMFEIVSNPSWGPPLRKVLGQLVNSELWNRLGGGTDVFPGGGKYEVARQIVSQYYQTAYKQVLMEYPALRAEIMRLEGVKAVGLLSDLTE